MDYQCDVILFTFNNFVDSNQQHPVSGSFNNNPNQPEGNLFLKEDNLESSGKYGKDQAEGQLERETPKTSERQEYERQSKNVFFQYYLTLSDLPQQKPFKIQFFHFS